MRVSIGTKMLAAFGGTIVVVVVVVCIIVGMQIYSSSVENFHESTAKELRQLDRAMSIFMDKALRMSKALGSMDVITK